MFLGKKDKKGKNKKDKKKTKSSKSTSTKLTDSEWSDVPEKEEEKPPPEIIVRDSEVNLTYLDYYPAEMCVWRSMEPYEITGNYTCTIRYQSEDL